MSEQKIAEIGHIAHTLSQQYDKLLEENREIREELERSAKAQKDYVEFEKNWIQFNVSYQKAITGLRFYAKLPCIQVKEVGWNVGYIARKYLKEMGVGFE